nr:unnamed protein product [Callosobruchus analis]
MFFTEREKQRERERERQRETERETERQRERHRERERDTEIERDGETERQRDRETDRERERERERERGLCTSKNEDPQGCNSEANVQAAENLVQLLKSTADISEKDLDSAFLQNRKVPHSEVQVNKDRINTSSDLLKTNEPIKMEQYAPLYDKAYKDERLKENAWKTIAEHLKTERKSTQLS